MRRGAHPYRNIIVVSVLVFLPLVFLYVQAHGRESSGRLQRAVQWVTGPVQSAAIGLQRAVTGVFDRYLFLRGAADENGRLKRQLEEHKLELQSLQEQARQNERLQRLLRLAEQVPGSRLVAARVIAFGASPSYRTLRINRGTSDGVQRRAAVITADGVVGRVVAAASGYADVLLIVDAGSRLDVVTARSRARGVLRGGEGNVCQVEAMDRTVDIEPGDLMLTSGLDGAIAAGIPVGTVSVVDRRPTGLYLDAAIDPFVAFSQLEEVLVLVAAPPELTWPEIGPRRASSLPRTVEIEPGASSAPASLRAGEPARTASSAPAASSQPSSRSATSQPSPRAATSQPASRAAASQPASRAAASSPATGSASSAPAQSRPRHASRTAEHTP